MVQPLCMCVTCTALTHLCSVHATVAAALTAANLFQLGTVCHERLPLLSMLPCCCSRLMTRDMARDEFERRAEDELFIVLDGLISYGSCFWAFLQPLHTAYRACLSGELNPLQAASFSFRSATLTAKLSSFTVVHWHQRCAVHTDVLLAGRWLQVKSQLLLPPVAVLVLAHCLIPCCSVAVAVLLLAQCNPVLDSNVFYVWLC
jgi:hypothetical protein